MVVPRINFEIIMRARWFIWGAASVLDYFGKVSTYHLRGGFFIVLRVPARLNLYTREETLVCTVRARTLVSP